MEGTPQGGPLSPLLANIYLDALDRELERRGHPFCRYADDCNIYVGSQAAAERTLESVQGWIEKHLRLKVNAAKSGTGRTWERKFLGFRLNRERQIEAAPESIERFKTKVREMWRSCQSRTSNQLRDTWRQYMRGWWGYYRLAENGSPIFGLEGWIRRHIRKCFWLRWHSRKGGSGAARLGLRGRMLKVAHRAPGRVASGQDRQSAKGAVERRPSPLWLSDAIGSCGDVRPLASTAGCGKPHVRWCGRVTGRNPRHSTRSFRTAFGFKALPDSVCLFARDVVCFAFGEEPHFFCAAGFAFGMLAP